MLNSTGSKFVACFSALALCAVGFFVSSARAQEPGQTPRPKSTEPVREKTEEELVRLDQSLEYFQDLPNEGPLLHHGQLITDPKRSTIADRELKAFDYILAFAKDQPLERLRKYSAKNVPLANLFYPIRKDYIRELIHIEGKLALVLELKPTDDLKDFEKFEHIYEAWVFVNVGGYDKLFCVMVSELPEGIKPGENQTARIAFDAYYFKLLRYASRRPKERNDPDKKQWEIAPLFLGRSFEALPPEPPEPTYSPTMLTGIAIGLGALIVLGIGTALWFRRGDRRVGTTTRERLHETVSFENIPGPQGPANPFSETS
jgi:hypothetical protein